MAATAGTRKSIAGMARSYEMPENRSLMIRATLRCHSASSLA